MIAAACRHESLTSTPSPACGRTPLLSSDGFTGLEAALILIAFVVVASVFSYIMLGAGFFATEKGQSTVHSTVEQTSSTIIISGDVYGKATTPTNLDNIFYTVSLGTGGTPVDFSRMIFSYMDSNGGRIPSYRYSSACTQDYAGEPIWCIQQQYNTVGIANEILDPGEQFTILVTMPATATPGTVISVNMQLAGGTTTSLQRKIPPALNAYQILI